jgi:hypothetical protein
MNLVEQAKVSYVEPKRTSPWLSRCWGAKSPGEEVVQPGAWGLH